MPREAIFNTTSSDLKWRNGQKVRILRVLTDEESATGNCEIRAAGCGKMYRIKFTDGPEYNAFEYEVEFQITGELAGIRSRLLVLIAPLLPVGRVYVDIRGLMPRFTGIEYMEGNRLYCYTPCSHEFEHDHIEDLPVEALNALYIELGKR